MVPLGGNAQREGRRDSVCVLKGCWQSYRVMLVLFIASFFPTFLCFYEVYVVTCYVQNILSLFCTFDFLYIDANWDGYCKYNLDLVLCPLVHKTCSILHSGVTVRLNLYPCSDRDVLGKIRMKRQYEMSSSLSKIRKYTRKM